MISQDLIPENPIDAHIRLHRSNLISDAEFLRRVRAEAAIPEAEYDEFTLSQPGHPRSHFTRLLPVERPPTEVSNVDHQWEIVYGLLRSQQGKISLNEGNLTRDEKSWSLRPLRFESSEIGDRLKAVLIAIAIKYGVVNALPGQPTYTGPISVSPNRTSLIYISGQPIRVTDYLEPDPAKRWEPQLLPPRHSEIEPVGLTLGYRPLDQKQLIYRVYTRYVHRLPELVQAILDKRGREMVRHPNLAIRESEIVESAMHLDEISVSHAFSVLLVALKYQIVDPLPGQTRYTGLIQFNSAAQEVTIDKIPILADHMAPGPSLRPPREERSPVSPYITIGTSPGSSGVTSISSYVDHWQHTFDLNSLAEPKIVAECRQVLDLMSQFMHFPPDAVLVRHNSRIEDAGRYTRSTNRIEFGRSVVNVRDTFLHEIGHWTSYVVSGGKPGDMTTEPFYSTHAAMIDLYERNQSKYPLLDPELITYVGDAREMWARAFEGYFYLKIGHEGTCRVFDSSRPGALRNLAWWDRDEFAECIFPQIEDVFVRAGLVT